MTPAELNERFWAIISDSYTDEEFAAMIERATQAILDDAKAAV